MWGSVETVSNLGALIQDFQDRHGSSERFIADKVGVSRTIIGRWKRGDYFELPAREILANVADFLRLDYETVLQAALDDTYLREAAEYDEALSARRSRRRPPSPHRDATDEE